MTQERRERGPRIEERENTVGEIPEPRSSLLVLRSSGFTLLELLVVIVIIAVSAALVAPRLPSSEGAELQSSARGLAATLRYLEERSVSGKLAYRLRLNMAAGTIRITRKMPSGDEIPPDDRLLTREILASSISITDVSTPRLGKVSEGEVTIDFGGAGLTEFLTVHLASPTGKAFTVAAFPNNGRVKTLAGYEELAL